MYSQGLSLRTTGQPGIWPSVPVIPLPLWCLCVGSCTLHQAMCDDEAALLLLSFNLQQKSCASLLLFLSFNVQQKCNASVQSTTARYDHHHANTSVSLA